MWPDERDWRWRTVELSRFFVEDQAQTDIELVTATCVETIFTAQYLFEMYEQFKDLESPDTVDWNYSACPWNIRELSALLVWIANQFAKTDMEFFDMMDIQRRVQNGDLTYNAIFSDSYESSPSSIKNMTELYHTICSIHGGITETSSSFNLPNTKEWKKESSSLPPLLVSSLSTLIEAWAIKYSLEAKQ